METCAFIVFPCVFNLSPVWSFGDFMSAKFLLAHYFCLSPLPSVTYRCLKLFLIKQKNAFCGQKFPLSGDMTSQRLVVTRDDPNITESFLTWDSAKMKRNRERKGGERKWQRKKERKKERKRACERKQDVSYLSWGMPLCREHNLQSISDSEMRSSDFDWFRS